MSEELYLVSAMLLLGAILATILLFSARMRHPQRGHGISISQALESSLDARRRSSFIRRRYTGVVYYPFVDADGVPVTHDRRHCYDRRHS
ncbi:hypothetical protein [Aestuariirhabdus litorea]|uniref:Uncharacterized protein n=1 Tax=Aestuariirhabdus litorea TaxID=2528527 RepID=A0A3P3VPS3_9GAMM|nr:hypothetical protein [Aestuariirhabdus litorea]RRJ84610.1 hypothetical protein D0544_05765 [Aestuariirhabdus litorea]RWW97836.1 hypothetical protein DZC74_05760 [Endozoicomonadaceae bacterium GTF-13]